MQTFDCVCLRQPELVSRPSMQITIIVLQRIRAGESLVFC